MRFPLRGGPVRPFWKAVLAYTDEPGHTGPEGNEACITTWQGRDP